MAARYRELEMCAHTNALMYKPDKVPRWTKQQVLDRGWQTWQDHDHSCGEKLHKNHGYTNKVDGAEDHELDSSIVHFWEKLDMTEQRNTILKHVTAEREQRMFTHWEQATDLLEPHDPTE